VKGSTLYLAAEVKSTSGAGHWKCGWALGPEGQGGWGARGSGAPGPSPSFSFKTGRTSDLFVKNEPFLAKLSVFPNSSIKLMKFPSKNGGGIARDAPREVLI